MSVNEFSIPIRVYIEDTDAGGIVYYVNYLKYMERVRTEWLRSLGFQHYTLEDGDFLFVVHSANVRYLKPALMDDALLSKLKIIKLGKARFVFLQEIIREATGELLCSGEITIACVDPIKKKPKALPEKIYQSAAQILEEK